MGFQQSVKWDEGWKDHLKEPGVVMLDVRNADELTAKPAPGTVHVPVPMARDADECLKEGQSKLPADKATPIVVFCAVGGRSGRAAEHLRAMGYTNVKNGGGRDEVMQEVN